MNMINFNTAAVTNRNLGNTFLLGYAILLVITIIDNAVKTIFSSITCMGLIGMVPCYDASGLPSESNASKVTVPPPSVQTTPTWVG